MRNAFILALILIIGCSEEPEQPGISLPSDITYSIDVSSSIEGLVQAEVSAQKANFYTIIFKDSDGDIKESNPEGEASHIFTKSGTYAIIFRAHTIETAYIEAIDSVTIVVDETNLSGNPPTSGYSTPLTYSGYTMVWNDEFDGTSLNTQDWNFELGTGNNGWGNNELQYYLKENTTIKNGVLTITAKKQTVNTNLYSSSRITTQGKKSFKYGRIDIRAALPKGQGMWPALWMLGDNYSTIGWPKCGEIDIMELVGGKSAGNSDRTVHGTVHWDNDGSKAEYGSSNTLPNGDFSDEWHVFSLVWDDKSIKWYRDDIQYNVIDITGSALSEFQEKFFFIFNVAVGGNWPGDPDVTTQFPQSMHVDYIRVFQ